MKRSEWFKLLFFQILSVPTVIFIFRSLNEQRNWAAVIAGSLFLVIGFYSLFKVWRGGPKWRCLTFWAALLHLGLSTIPMLVIRLSEFQTDFTQVMIFGYPGPVFHYYAEKIYLGLMVSTFFDFLRPS